MRKSTMLTPFLGRRWHAFPEVDQLWNELMGFARHTNSNDTATSWAPAIDILENAEAYEVRAELAGVDPKNVDISLNGDVLTVRGEKQRDEKKNEDNWTLCERVWGSFERSFTLPAQVNADGVVAEAKNGVLTVRIPKAKEAKPLKIEVKGS